MTRIVTLPSRSIDVREEVQDQAALGFDGIQPEQQQNADDPSRLNNGWHVVGMVPLKELTADSASIRSFTVWIVFGSILAAIGIGYFMTRRIGNPLVQLSRLMRRSEAGDLSVRSKNVGPSEIGQLGRSFNKMIEQIDLLIRRIAAEESEKKKPKSARCGIRSIPIFSTIR